MLLPVEWVKDYIDTDKNGRNLADGLTSSGSNVESIYTLNKGLKDIIVGRIDKIEKHPNADKLIICQVNIGSQTIQIVTGADNVREGDYIPVATRGSQLANGMVIEETDFRGERSFGMLCSLGELGYDDSVIPRDIRDGIFILDKDYPLGANIVDIMGMDNEILEIEITPNRPDCLSIIGMARETAATFNIPLEEPTIRIDNEEDNILDYITDIEVDSPNCSRYFARIVKDVKIQESPLWLQVRLMEAGMRPVNNIVDITNYVMLEYGEPLHAFDLDSIDGRKIIIRQAKEGEKLITLDNVERDLNNDDLVIADEEKSIAIGGVMGGLNSEITSDTTTILIEGAHFNERSVRLTSKKLGLRTEASNRFEKGLDPNLCHIAVNRVCQLMESIGAGTIVSSSIDIYKEKRKGKTVTLRPERANMVLGLELGVDSMINYLNSLGLKSTFKNDLIYANIPSYRFDISLEVDLIEEIGRLYGYHNIKSQPLLGRLTRGQKPYEEEIGDRAKDLLLALGYNEVMTYSFISPKAYDKIKVSQDSSLRNYIRLKNPLGEDYSVMRTTLITNMMDLLSRNYNRNVKSVHAFEIGNIFIPTELPVRELPQERKIMSLAFYGRDNGFYYLKETVQNLLARLGINNVEYIREEDNPTFHPGRTANLLINGETIGVIGEIHPDVGENYNIDTRINMGQLNFHRIVQLSNLQRKYKSLPKYPAINRDIALVVDEEVSVGQIEDIILKHGEGLVEDIELFDIYRGNQVPENKKSIAFSILYRSYDRTLKDKEINQIQESIIEDLEDNLKAKLRS